MKNSFNKKIILLGIISILFSVFIQVKQVSATPTIGSVSGSIANGENVVVEGSEFGSKANAAPILFEQFEDGVSAGTELSTLGVWDTETANSITYSTSNQRSPFSTLNVVDSLSYDPASSANNGPFLKEVFPAEIGKKFISFWVYEDVVNNNSNGPWQIKTWRVLAGPEHGDYPMVSYSNWWNTTLTPYQDLYSNQGMGCNGYYDLSPELGKWMHMQVMIKDSTSVDGVDGLVRARMMHSGSNIIKTDQNCSTRTTAYPGLLRYIKFGYFITNGLNSGHRVDNYFDDIYIDNSWSRVEIGNNQVYEECDHLEIQPPTSWSPTSINFTFNQGSFNTGDTVYLFVVDENGAVNETGFPITIGNSNSTQYRADVDNNSQINTTDAMLTLRNSLGLDMSGTNWQSSSTTGDVNCDGNSNSTDAMLILRYSLGLGMSETSWCVE